MDIKIFNSLSGKKEEFIPIHGNDVRMYTCGVTVYDRSHIGHARSLYVFDVLRRYLKFRGFNVIFVRNITDIDDKIIDRARQTNRPAADLSEEQIRFYHEDLKALGVLPGDVEPKATDNIPEMVAHIQGLIDKGFAYALAGGDVYFDVRAFEGYGKLSGQSIDKMHEAVRIEKDSQKKDPLDFALWKASKPGEPSWDSPWGKGRPGWHIECSCMSMKHLNTRTLDIHAGGRDLIFPHHENEIAQSESLTGVPFAKYWIHHGLLTVNGQKMSKSAGNFMTVGQALSKYTADEIKMFFLFSHYASNIDFSEEKILEARKALSKFDVLFWRASGLFKVKSIEPVQAGFISKYKHEFIEAMDDDFNSPKALAALFNLINDTNIYIDQNSDDPNYLGVVYHAVDVLESLARNIFGLFMQEKDRELTPELKALLQERAQARELKNFKRSDELRVLLKEKGVTVEDGKNGQTWRWV
ncbi:MAG: cysteine--tRNA ligase [Candidatus Omnitrophica bacterium]|nr:cysteine--tRNA ligase [Candidatus Omnitrophota bacterium]MDE2008471.1 cysteine--tRNA ligase [Candidatus Omnitrophota bacterium]MDE2215217.1 cysteine--tRNA ligase [Candidatus Omnitrophota bacterium]